MLLDGNDFGSGSVSAPVSGSAPPEMLRYKSLAPFREALLADLNRRAG